MTLIRKFFRPIALAALALAATGFAPTRAIARQTNQFSPPQLAVEPLAFPAEPVPFEINSNQPLDSNVRQAGFDADLTMDASLTPSPAAPIAGDETDPSDPMTQLSGSWNNFSTMVQSQWKSSGLAERWNSLFAGADIGRMLGSLALVLGGYFGFVWLLRTVQGQRGKVPVEVLELLGTVPLSPRKQLQIVRLGSKLLLIVDSDDGTHPIGEISDPEEVEYLASLCPGRKKTNVGITQRVRSATEQLATDRVRQEPAPSPAPPTSTTTTASNPPDPSDNHLAAILQALNGPRSGNAAVFEG
ncbi:MAG: flagellar biosynthetic protein FliO [Planctomycetota bacterium]